MSEAQENESASGRVKIYDDLIQVTSIRIRDAALAEFLRRRSPSEQDDLVEQAFRIGLLALERSNSTLDVDHVRRAFDGMKSTVDISIKDATTEVRKILEDHFLSPKGTLPAKLNDFLGDEGKLAQFTRELFDPRKTDSAPGRLHAILDKYFDGESGVIGKLLDPREEQSPLRHIKADMDKGIENILLKIQSLETKMETTRTVKQKGTAKGADFETRIINEYAGILSATEDMIEATGAIQGRLPNSKKGDAVITVDGKKSASQGGRIVVEIKDRKLTHPEIQKELTAGKENRDAAVALMIFSTAAAPLDVAPFRLDGNDVICAVDTEEPDLLVLATAFRLAKIMVKVTRDIDAQDGQLDLVSMDDALSRLRKKLEAISNIKRSLTGIKDTSDTIRDELDRVRADVEVEIKILSAQIHGAGPSRGS